jgi:magnesium-transporting ATPase (P-type)
MRHLPDFRKSINAQSVQRRKIKMWMIIPKFSLAIYAFAFFAIYMWCFMQALNKREFWFAFLKITEIGVILALLEHSSGWYWLIRADGETIGTSILMAILGVLATAIGFFGFALLCAFLYFASKKIYRFALSGPVAKIKARIRRWLDGNWRTADKIVEQGLWKVIRNWWLY